VTISLVLRLAPEALAAGRLAGEAELVETGERTVIRDAGELVAFLRRDTGDDGEPSAAD
jgi:hypothetical protein